MNLVYIDFLASKNNTFLHRLRIGWKLFGFGLIFLVILFSPTWQYPSIVYVLLLCLIVIARLPLSRLFPITLYPLVFTGILLVSYQNLTFGLFLHFVFRVLLASTTVILFLVTTPFPKIFSLMSKFAPMVLVSALFLTYRSIFILNDVLSDLRTGMYLRGGFRTRNPWRKLRNIGVLLGQVFISAYERSSRLTASLYVRGYRGRIYG